MKSILVILFLLTGSTSFSQVYNIKDYGAIANGRTICTDAIQKTIDICNKNGGGTVLVPAGEFVTGTFHLKSNVNLYLENGSILRGSSHLKDYTGYKVAGYDSGYYGLIFTEKAENVSISGMGTIDGNDQFFFNWNKAKSLDSNTTQFTRQKENYRKVDSGIGDGPVVPNINRPHQMVVFSICKNVQVKNIMLVNSPFWTLHFADCDAVLVSGIRLWSNLYVPNADGIDVTSCTNVTISDCDIRTGDDAIAIVGFNHHFEIPGFNGLHHLSENIVVTNCNLQSSSSAIRIGFLDQNTVRNIHVSNVNITNSTRGIGIFLRDEGSLENMTFSDITIETKLRTGDWWGNGEPIHISAINGRETCALGHIKNISFHNISCISENGIIVFGTKESQIEDVSFDNISLDIVNSKLNDVVGGNIDLRGCWGIRNGLFAHDIPGIFAQYVNGFSIDHFKLLWDKSLVSSYFKNAVAVDQFTNLSIHHFKGTAAPNAPDKHILDISNGKGFETDLDKKSVLSKKIQ